MCAQYLLKTNTRDLIAAWNASLLLSGLTEGELSFHVFPHKPGVVIKFTENESMCAEANYSLIPHWSKVRRPKFATYNARFETVFEKPTWREPILQSRCIVPMTSFREWVERDSGKKQLIDVHGRSPLMFAAGLASEWLDKETGELVNSYAVLTHEPAQSIEEMGHDRMPVFFDQESARMWIDPAKKTQSEIRSLVETRIVDDNWDSIDIKKS
jgi:putative SOS response-associated peptidase YedK